LLLADVMVRKNPDSEIIIEIDNDRVRMESDGEIYFFTSSKSLRTLIKISPEGYESRDLA